MNKNPTRPRDVDKIISQLLNPKETPEQRYRRIQKEIEKMIFER